MMKGLLLTVRTGLLLMLLIAGTQILFGQEKTITGTVTDAEAGETLIGVNITPAADVTIGTVSDIDGNYKITVPDSIKALKFSYVGYTSQVVEITSNVIDVELMPGKHLSEVVVVGYGTQKTKEVTSAVTSVKEEDFNNGHINDPIQLIQGKVAGLSISKAGGDPNGDFTVRLRGLSTFGSNTEPLIIIDGVQGADLNSVDPQDIASMDVLKDASAAAIYGTKGASGVILITTKKGEYTEGVKMSKIEFTSNLTMESVARKTSVLTADEYLGFDNATDFENNTDWIDQITRTAYQQAYALAVSGATKTSNYRVSFNYRKGNGTVLNTGFDQLNGRLNFTQRALNDMLTLNFNLATTTRNETYAPSEALTFATRYNPTAPVMADDELSQEWGGYFQREAFYFYNPFAIIDQNTLDGKKQEILGSIKADLRPVDGLTLSVFYSQSHGNDVFGQYYSKNSYWTPYAIGSHQGYARKENQNRFHHLMELTGEYEKRFGKLNTKLLVGYSWQENVDDLLWAFGKGYLTDGFLYNNIGSGAGELNGPEYRDTYKSGHTLIGYFARFTANWDNAIFLTANFRRDGSSMFGENNKWGDFPGVSLGFDITRYVEIPAVDRLKIRGGVGVTGNLPPDPYLSKLLYNVTDDNFFYNGEFIQAYAPIRNENPKLKWETKRELGFGIDFLILSKLSGSIDYYRSISSDLMLEFTVPVPPNPTDRMWINLGELENSGLELALGYDVFEKENWSWTTNLNFTKYFETKLVTITSDKTNNESEIFLGGLGAPFLTGTNTIKAEEGQPIGQIIAPIYIGVDSTGKLIHQSDSVFNAQTDVQVVGNGLPSFELGWANSFTYKNWFCNFFIRGVFGHSLINVNNARYGVPVVMGIQSGMQLALDFEDAVDGPVYSDVHVEKADFVKLDNFSIGYNFSFSDSKYVDNLKIFLSGQNLFVITNYSGVDPEVRYGDTFDNNNPLAPGIDRENTYFRTRSVTLGLNLLF